MRTKNKKTLKGFSLGEVILSIVVLTVGLLPILASMSGALKTTLDSEDSIIAAGLAQEGAELVINVRDNAFACKASGVSACASYTGFEKFPGDQKYCRIDYNDDVFLYDDAHRSTGLPCFPFSPWESLRFFDLQNDSVNGFYQHSWFSEGKFKRKIVLDSDGTDSYAVYSVVWWGSWSPNNGNTVSAVIADLSSNCTTANKCLYTRVELSSWR